VYSHFSSAIRWRYSCYIGFIDSEAAFPTSALSMYTLQDASDSHTSFLPRGQLDRGLFACRGFQPVEFSKKIPVL
jgi:hypothetical protein